MELVRRHMHRVLQAAELAMSERQYPLFRKLTLDEFGEQGLESELRELERGDNHRPGVEGTGMGWNESSGKGGAS